MALNYVQISAFEIDPSFVKSGAFGEVRKFQKRQLRHDEENYRAVKSFKDESSFEDEKKIFELIKAKLEIDGRQRHSNIVHCFGFCKTFDFSKNNNLYTDSLVLEFCDNDLESYLTLPRKVEFGPKLTIAVMSDVIKGLKFLESKKLCHRDIKPRNILLKLTGNEIHHALLTDFGLSKEMVDNKTGSKAGTKAWEAPEVQAHGFQIESDIWSVGLVLVWCKTHVNLNDYKPLLTPDGKNSYKRFKNGKHAHSNKVKDELWKLKPRIVRCCDNNQCHHYPYEELFTFAEKCLEDNHEKRAKLDELLKILKVV